LGSLTNLRQGLKEISVVGLCFMGLFLYIGCLFATGAAKPAELKAILRRNRG
jgi:putative peptidoglycan lipid II flippase